MKKQDKYDMILLLILTVTCCIVGILFISLNQEPQYDSIDYFSSMDMNCEIPDIPPFPAPEPVYPEVIDDIHDIRQLMGELSYQRRRIVLGDSHRMFITAYCSAECGGSTMTSSGATVHREDDPYEPTTCAIDRRYFSYGDLFYIPSEDRIYVAEDTGSGVKGMWLDEFHLTMGDVNRYNTRYETVYECEIVYDDILLSNFDIREEINYYYFSKKGNVICMHLQMMIVG